MSVDTPAGDGLGSGTRFDCTICAGVVESDAGRFLATYAASDDLPLSPAAADGLLALCEECSAAVSELTDAWTTVERPPVGAEATIAESYERVARTCSFCDDGVGDGPVLGLESWRGEGRSHDGSDQDEGSTGHDNYALCRDCVSIFEEFLRGIPSE